MFLLDTNVVSETRRARPHGSVMAWLQSAPEDRLFIPSVVAGEIEIGIMRAARTDPDKAQEIAGWFDALLQTANWIAPGPGAFRRWGRLVEKAGDVHAVDALIAALALEHSGVVVTRNVADFVRFGVETLNPFETVR